MAELNRGVTVAELAVATAAIDDPQRIDFLAGLARAL